MKCYICNNQASNQQCPHTEEVLKFRQFGRTLTNMKILNIE